MSGEDRQRWDKRWAAEASSLYEPSPLLTKNVSLLAGEDALDLACGRGQNAIWLAQHGYQVLGVDISPVALEVAQAEAERQGVADRIRFERVDLDHWRPAKSAYDLICVFRFLDRRLFPVIRGALRPGGLIVYCTRHTGALRRNPNANTAYLLQPGELRARFGDWQLLHYREGPENAEVIARKVKNIREASN